MLKIKRAYEKKEATDGKRIYVDRLWPRGLSKEEAAIDEWLRDLSPSDELRKWFGHEPGKFQEFKKRYLDELSSPAEQALLKRIAGMAEDTNVTLVYSAKDTEHNNAVVLQELIGRLMKTKAVANRGKAQPLNQNEPETLDMESRCPSWGSRRLSLPRACTRKQASGPLHASHNSLPAGRRGAFGSHAHMVA